MLLTVSALVGGCATVARAAFETPVVELRDVRLSAVAIDGGTLDVLLHVYNPNDFNLDASTISYEVLIDSTVLGTGAAEQRVVVPALDSAMVRLPVHFTWRAAQLAGTTLANTGSVVYRVKGAMRIASGVGTITLPYDQRGRFSAPALR